jgi:hypothetical protein
MQIFILHKWVRGIVPATLLLALTFAQAQTPSDDKQLQQTDPLNADAPIPALTYRSSFTDYRLLSEEPLAGWKSSNDLAAEIGGWRAYGKESLQPDAPDKDHAGHHGGKP